MRRTVLLALVAVVGLCSLVAVGSALVLTQSPTAVLTPVAPTQAALTACAPEVATERPASENGADCLEARLDAMASQDGLLAVEKTLDFPVPGPSFRIACHDATHALGKKYYTQYPNLSDAVKLELHSCEAGLLHGIFDAAALHGTTEENEKGAVAACETLSFTVYCSDGIGHLFWTSTQDFDRALAKCAWFTTQPTKQSCTEGILMRMLIPQAGVATRAYSIEELTEVCAGPWPADAEEARPACAAQIALGAVSADMMEPLGELAQNSLTEGAIQALEPALAKTDELCQTIPGDDLKLLCKLYVATTVHRRTNNSDLLFAYACLRLPADVLGNCLSNEPVGYVPAGTTLSSLVPQQVVNEAAAIIGIDPPLLTNMASRSLLDVMNSPSTPDGGTPQGPAV